MESLALLDLKNSRPVPPSEEARSDDLLTGPGHPNTFLEDCQRAGFSSEAGNTEKEQPKSPLEARRVTTHSST